MTAIKTAFVGDLQQNVGELIRPITFCPSIIILGNILN
jgi:hypothetical protein